MSPMQSSSYSTLILPDASASTDEDEEEDDYDGYGDYVYDVADKLRDVNARLQADATPVESERPRKVQFRDDPVEAIVCFSPGPDDVCYSEANFISAILHDDVAKVQTPQGFEMGLSTIMTNASSVNNAGNEGYGIADDHRRDSVDDSIDESLHDLSGGSGERESDGSHAMDGKVRIECSVPVLNGVSSLDYSSDHTGSDCESVTEELADHDSAGSFHPDTNIFVDIQRPHDSAIQLIPYQQPGGDSLAIPTSSVPSTSSNEDLRHQENAEDKTPRKGPTRRPVSSADWSIRPETAGRGKELARPRTSPGLRSKETVQPDRKIRLPHYIGNVKSVYGLSKEAKEELARKKREERLRIKQKELELQKEQEERKYEAQLAFQAWLEKKERQKRESRRSQSEVRKTSTKDEEDLSSRMTKVWKKRSHNVPSGCGWSANESRSSKRSCIKGSGTSNSVPLRLRFPGKMQRRHMQDG